MTDKPPLVKITARAATRLQQGYPWVFANDVTNLDALKTETPGRAAQIAAPDGKIIATAFANRHSLIALRVIGSGTVAPDAAFFADRIRAALSRREGLFAAPFYRLVHAEGDALPGLVIDRFDNIFSVQLNSAGADLHAPAIIAALQSVFPNCGLVVRRDTPGRAHEGLPVVDAPEIIGNVPTRIEVLQNGVTYLADLLEGQKTGWYFDQADNHALIARMAKGKSMLDLYTHAGGFALAAAKAGAGKIVAVDSAAPALELAGEAARLNKLDIKFERDDVFDHLAASNAIYDIVVADPPPFVRSRKDLESGARGYRKLAKFCMGRVAKGGIFAIASCSHNMPLDRFYVEVAAGIASAGRTGRILYTTGASPDHPAHFALPESAYLKMVTYQID